MMHAALVLPETRVGMMEPSAIRRLSMPRTRSRSSTTAIGSWPILQVPTGWNAVWAVARIHSTMSSSDSTSGPGFISKSRKSSIALAPTIFRTHRTLSTRTRRSSGSERKLRRMAGASEGSRERMWIEPRLSGRRIYVVQVMPGSGRRLRSFGARIAYGAKWTCTSGASSPSRLRRKASTGAEGRLRNPPPVVA